MIKLITGVPGSGKTYLAVSLMVEEYFDYNKDQQMFFRSGKKKDVTIFHNIEGLTLAGTKNLDDIFFENQISFDSFFKKDYQDKIHQKYTNCCYFIDEAQRYLGSKGRGRDWFYFDYHRHYGDTIYLVSQDYTKIHRDINSLVEFEYRAIKPSFSLTSYDLNYVVKSSGQIFARKSIKKKKRIFNTYKSFKSDGGDLMSKAKSPFKYIIIISFIVFLYFGYKFLTPAKEIRPVENVKINNKINDKINDKVNDKVNDFFSLEIVKYAALNGKVLRIFCPLRKRWINTESLGYNVRKINGNYYAILNRDIIEMIKNVELVLDTDINTKQKQKQKQSFFDVGKLI